MKKLKDILFKVNINSVYGDTDKDIKKITFDSGKVETNTLFVAVKGYNMDGNDFIDHLLKEEHLLLFVKNYLKILKKIIQFIYVLIVQNQHFQ